MRLLIAILICYLLTFTAQASVTVDPTITAHQPLLVLTSQRNAETIAEGIRLFNSQHPELAITARTDTQLAALTSDRYANLLRQSGGVIIIGMFGPVAERLLPLLDNNKPLIAISSDKRLERLSRLANGAIFSTNQQLQTLAKQRPGDDFSTWLQRLQKQYPKQSPWVTARAYWQASGSDNAHQLFSWMYNQMGVNIHAKPPEPLPRVQWLYKDQRLSEFPLKVQKPFIAVIDHAGGARPADSFLLKNICTQVRQQLDAECVSALAHWGEAGVSAVSTLSKYTDQLIGIVMMQDFVIGGGEGREAVSAAFQQLNVPVIKAIKLRDRTEATWQLSSDGIAREKVYYQVAMPEMQGASQPMVIATAGKTVIDEISGIQIQPIRPVDHGIESLLNRLDRWHQLRKKPNKQKRLAIIYYNHPPGRHNIGADNLDVPASLFHLLRQLKQAGYHTGKLPDSPEALLDILQTRGVNLPNNANALADMAAQVTRIPPQKYQQWFRSLPQSIQQEMTFGPLGLLHEKLSTAISSGKKAVANQQLHHTMEELHHMLEGVDHRARNRALILIEKLERCYQDTLSNKQPECSNQQAQKIIHAIKKTGIEGLGGWGKAPGEVMVHNQQILLPGLTFGNIFIGPQPPRGWEINEELLHANLVFPPPHQYLAFYQFLQKEFKADAFIHLGRHSTYEFLPHRAVGLTRDDYSPVMAGDIPGLYPYIVDGVGEGIQAKRRGLAVMVDHLTPPLASTPLYDELLQLRQLVESFESRSGGDNKALTDRLIQKIRQKVNQLELKDELAESMSGELAIMGISFDEVDDHMLVHEVGHYLTELQEKFMPMGLHVFGQPWQQKGIELMLDSMSPKDTERRSKWRTKLTQSPHREMAALLNGLNGGFISPGQGNDPIRSPSSLPTGRNFYALDNSLVPSRAAWEIGKAMATKAREANKSHHQQDPTKREALVLWASDVVRDEGVMIAFGLDMLGVEPVWNSRGLVKGIKHQVAPLKKVKRVRRDVLFTTSGLFRDLYGQQMALLNKATLLAIDASADLIIKDYPALTLALQSALSPIKDIATGGSEPLESNQVANHWVTQAKGLLTNKYSAEEAGIAASLRIFGDAPGSYGAGINRLTERSGAWEHRSELASVYMRRLGHSYGSSTFGKPVPQLFEQLLGSVENTYFGRSSNLYGLIDNNDAFDYLGGLSLAVETLTGSAPNNFVLDHTDANNLKAQPLSIALRQELRGRFLNPEWLKALMPHGYAGARTMGSEFLEYLWGWQVTNPTLVGNWAWEEVKAVYLDDRYQLKLDEFLAQGNNVHVKSNMLAIMLVAIHKQFWQADGDTTRQLAKQFAALVITNGLPGSGHTNPNHPMLPWLEQHLSDEDWQALSAEIVKARVQTLKTTETHQLTELESLNEQQSTDQDIVLNDKALSDKNKALDDRADSTENPQENAEENPVGNPLEQYWQWLLILALMAIVGGGFYRGIRLSGEKRSHLK